MICKKKGFTFEACHFLRGVEKCRQLHGHTYQLNVSVAGTKKANDMVVDFREISQAVKKIVEEWDHKLLVDKKDVTVETDDLLKIEGDNISITILKSNVVVFDGKPTCEVMCETILRRLKKEMPGLFWLIELSEGLDNWVAHHG